MRAVHIERDPSYRLRVLAPWSRARLRCARCGRRDVHPTIRPRWTVVFSRDARARVYVARCAQSVLDEQAEWSFCRLPTAVQA